MKKTNATKTNATINFTPFIENINALDENGNLVYGVKNNVQRELAKIGVMVNANSDKCVPRDAYVRFKNNAQYQLQYSAKNNRFVGFNIRLCTNEHISLFNKWLNDTDFNTCNDNQRILVSKFLPLEYFNDVVNILMNLPKYDRDVIVPVKSN